MASGGSIVPKPTLGQYVFSEKLGSGTYATVYKAYRKTGVREVVAIKCVLKSSLNKGSTDNLITEIEILKKLKHQHIVTLKDFLWDSHYIYLVMEYCGGGDLSKFIRTKRALPESVVRRFLQQIASAMKFLWDNSIAHMDLKPQNILLSSTSNPQIKLADFGFAKPLYDGDSLQVMRGSPLYMAPEIICNKHYDNRVDLWSIGVILYECLFGRAPFASKTFKELGAKIWDAKPVEIPLGFTISDNSRDLILRLLERDPDNRIRFEEFFAHPFVDLEHVPSKDSLANAIAIVSKAVEEDKKGNLKSAVRWYCECLSFFMAAIHYEPNTRKKSAIREKVKEYMDRAEVLKQMMKPQGEGTDRHHQSHSLLKPQVVINADSTDSETAAANNGLSKLSLAPPDTNTTSTTTPTPTLTTTPNTITPSSSSSSSKKSNSKPHSSTTTTTSPDNNNKPPITFSSTSSTFHSPPSSPTSSNHSSPSSPHNSPSILTNDSSDHHKMSLGNRRNSFQQLYLVCNDSPELTAALKLIDAALIEERTEDFTQCLHHFEIGLGALLKLLPEEPKGKTKELINSQIPQWMEKAEAVKSYLEVQQMDLKTGSSILNEDDEAHLLSESKQCSLQ